MCHAPDGAHGLQVAVMLRSDVFGGTCGRTMKQKPPPHDVFDLVNAVVARHLARAPLALPDFAAVARVATALGVETKACPQEPKKRRVG